MLTKLKGIIFMSTKNKLFNKILLNTNSSRSKPAVVINRPRALKAKESIYF